MSNNINNRHIKTSLASRSAHAASVACLTLAAFVALTSAQNSFAPPRAAVPTPSATETKEFTLTLHYYYQEMKYDPVVTLPFLSGAPASWESVEQSLMSHLSAMKSGDYDWWLNTWEPDSRAKLVEADKAAGKTKEDRIKDWKERFGATQQVTLVRWILTGRHVILTYRLGTGATAALKPEIAVVLQPSEGEFKATFALDNDPVLLHFADKQNIFEKVIR